MIRRTPIRRSSKPLKRGPAPKKVSSERSRRWAKCKRLIRKRSGGQCEVMWVMRLMPDYHARCGRKAQDGAHFPYNRAQSAQAWDHPDCVVDACRECHDVLDRRVDTLDGHDHRIYIPKAWKDRAFAAILASNSKVKPRERSAA
jgi:hypothetical protein